MPPWLTSHKSRVSARAVGTAITRRRPNNVRHEREKAVMGWPLGPRGASRLLGPGQEAGEGDVPHLHLVWQAERISAIT